MIRKLNNPKLLSGLALVVALTLASCRTGYKVVNVEGGRVAMDSTWDARPGQRAVALLKPYKAYVDSTMSSVLGTAAVSMKTGRPESALSNLIADVLREAASGVLGHPADMALVNMGGIRNVLTKGPITMENAYELLPFENSLCVLTLNGSLMKQLLENIAAGGGEGVSGVRMEITEDGQLLSALVGGKPVEDDRDYTVATLDYLAEGNDGMYALTQASERVCPPGQAVRSLFIRYVEEQTRQGREITSQVEGRITVKKQ